MPNPTHAAQQAKIKEQIEELQKQAQALQARLRKSTIDSIIKSMCELDISPQDIVDAYHSHRRAHEARKAVPVPPKYRHPQTSESWSGRGKTPLWLMREEANGVPREHFLLDR